MKLLKLVASAVALCAVFSVQARTFDEIKKDGKILIATEGQFAPFNFFNGTTLTGFVRWIFIFVVSTLILKTGYDAFLR
jgi:polar amino acid transport system substrate-binding protein